MRKVALALLSLGVTSAFGCTAILGSFDVAAGAGGTPDGATDALGSETSSDAGDAADGFDPSAYLLTCSMNESKVATLTGSATGFQRRTLAGFRMGNNNQFRIVYRDAVVNNGGGAPPTTPLFVVGTVSTQSNGPPQFNTMDGPITFGNVVDSFRYQGGFAVVTYEFNGSTNSGVVKIYLVSDNVQTLPAPVTLTAPLTGGGPDSVNVRAVDMDMQGNDVFLAVTFQSNQNSISWSIARVSTSGSPVDLMAAPHVVKTFMSNGGGATSIGGALRGRPGKVLLFDGKGPDQNDPTGTTYYEVPDNETEIAALGGMISGRSLTAQGSPAAVVLTGANTAAGANLSAGDVDFSPGAQTPLVLRGGAIPTAKLGSFVSADLPVLATFKGINDIPFASPGGDGPPDFRFVTPDDLFGIGPGFSPTFQGMNLLWYNTTVNVLRAKIDSSKPLLPTHSVEQATAVPAQSLSGPAADFDIVWAESDSTDGGASQKLLTGHLSCFR